MDLLSLGWSDYWEEIFTGYRERGLVPARVVVRNRGEYQIIIEENLVRASLSGRFRHLAADSGTLPAVGDWVAIQGPEQGGSAVIQALLPRRTCFSRKPAVSGGRKLKNGSIDGGVTIEQVLAANVDTVLIVSGLDGNFNLSRLERYLTVARSSGAEPVILLNKADLCPDPEPYRQMVRQVAPDLTVLCTSVVRGDGLAELRRYLTTGRTLAFLGSSGVGKSTLINHLFGAEVQRTQTTSSANGKGRHTTTRAELSRHESGGLLLDTPGLRELQLWCDTEAVEDSFADIQTLAGQCRFGNCRHQREPGCAIRQAINAGQLSPQRYDNYLRLYREAEQLAARQGQKERYLAKTKKREATNAQQGG